MTATFEIIINNIRTATVGELTDVIKHVGWTLKGTQDGQSFGLPQETELGPFNPENFSPLASFTSPAQVIAWVESAHADLDSVKAHIQQVLDKQCAKAALADAAMPWAPAPEPEVAP